ncbi:hypothetical protein PRECH8_19640 [Insulibacter thermoxylanivorax]|uniref:Uncharacterized protein n=1 Tax=Insulibacter thermoxylanivorax TaxID=2749268 RepID=A0A916QFV9_9BACL|nr:hypothetical protein [Insulibacter thermoxylanivorax]GFR38668.1 hypothetical protein PRECH8_19640 [Insulibacter thermoxylanivorax]
MARKMKAGLYTLLCAGMLIYAVPRLSIGNGWTQETLFGVIWICMVLLIIAAQLHDLLGVDEKTDEEIRKLKRYKYWRLQQRIIQQAERDRGNG